MDEHPSCRRCGRDLATTPAGHEALPWWDTARVRAQGWVGADIEDAIGVECLSHTEADFLLPAPTHRRSPGSGRFERPVRSPSAGPPVAPALDV